VADRKVVALGEIVERIARTDLETGASTIAQTHDSTAAKVGIGVATGVLFIWIGYTCFIPSRQEWCPIR
jgi:hypothetical protein